jgi:hypothetical protein
LATRLRPTRGEPLAARRDRTRRAAYGNQVTILIDFPDRGLAEAFAFDTRLPDLMSRAGVVNAPEIASVELSEQLSC